MPIDLLFYDPSAREAELLEGYGLARRRRFDRFRTSWTHIVAGNFRLGTNDEELLLYDASRGEAEVLSVDRRGRMTRLWSFGGWRTSWSEVIPGNFLNDSYRTDLLLYDRSNGDGELYSFDDDGGMFRRDSFTHFRSSWSQIVALRLLFGTYLDQLLFYDSSARDGELYAPDGKGSMDRLIHFIGWRRSWSQMVPAGFGRVLLYDASARDIEIVRVPESGSNFI
jgi:hypothetical protein